MIVTQKFLSKAQLLDDLSLEQIMLSAAFDYAIDNEVYDVLGDILKTDLCDQNEWFDLLINLLYQGLLVEVSCGVTVPRAFWPVVADRVGIWYPELGVHPPSDAEAYSLAPKFAAHLDEMVAAVGEDAALHQAAEEFVLKLESRRN